MDTYTDTESYQSSSFKKKSYFLLSEYTVKMTVTVSFCILLCVIHFHWRNNEGSCSLTSKKTAVGATSPQGPFSSCFKSHHIHHRQQRKVAKFARMILFKCRVQYILYTRYIFCDNHSLLFMNLRFYWQWSAGEHQTDPSSVIQSVSDTPNSKMKKERKINK